MKYIKYRAKFLTEKFKENDITCNVDSLTNIMCTEIIDTRTVRIDLANEIITYSGNENEFRCARFDFIHPSNSINPIVNYLKSGEFS